ncbi:MAG: DJ-1/PfpI family protein [Proteobacteria bacterium]|nr:DJ-1/PfpI family protein [Pseudomonadota bacterium]
MRRRDVIAAGVATTAALAAGGVALSQAVRPRKVAFMVTPGHNVIDLAGAWEVFQDSGFELYTVGPSRAPLRMTGGLQVAPDYSFADAPQPDVVSVGAQSGSPEAIAWLKRASANAEIVMSVCTGAFKLAATGLLDGLSATTHHDFWDKFEQAYPKVKLVRGRRFVDNGKFVTAGGLTSGVDSALHVVARLKGEDAAAETARYMEHDGDGWKTGVRA